MDGEQFKNAIKTSFEHVTNALREGQISVKKIYDPERVKYSCYQQQQLYCQGDNGKTELFYAWTLFVLWDDDTTDYWFKARDVSEGIGYKSENLRELKNTLSGNDELILWEELSRLLYTPTKVNNIGTEEKGAYDTSRGITNSQSNVSRTPFLTENGLYVVYQIAPKCKLFRVAVAKLLHLIRQNYKRTYEFTAEQLEQLVGEKVAAKLSLTDRERSEYDQKIAELNEKLNRVKNELGNKETQYAEQIANLNEKVKLAENEYRTREIFLRTEFDVRIDQLNKKFDHVQKEFKEKEELLNAHLRDKTREISDLYEHRTLLQDELQGLHNEINARNETLQRVSAEHEQLRAEHERLNDETTRLSTEINRKRDQLDKFRRGFLAFRKVYVNPRNVSIVDGTFAIAKEPCVFFTHFGKLLVGGTRGNEWHEGFCVLRRQRRGLASETKYMFQAYEAENGGTNYRVNNSYRTMGVLSRMCTPSLARIDSFELPYGRKPQDFLVPTSDYKLNQTDRFLLLNTANAVSFMNMIIDGRYDDTMDADYTLPAKRSASNYRSDDERPAKIRRLYTRRRGDGLDDQLNEDASADPDDESSFAEQERRNEQHAREESKAQQTTRLIQRIVRENPELYPALTLKRYRYKLPYDPLAGEINEQLGGSADQIERARQRLHGHEYQTAATVYYTTNPAITGAQVLNAISMLWQELNNEAEIESNDTMNREIESLLNLFDD